MRITISQLEDWYIEFNTTVFNGQCPDLGKVKFIITHNYHQLGQFLPRYGVYNIKISEYYIVNETEYRNTLLHEMCHLWCHCNGYRREGHGPNWKRIARIATRLTGLDITRTSSRKNYEVDPRFKAKADSLKNKKFGVYPIVVLDYGDHKFCIKTSKNVLCKYSDYCGEKLLVGDLVKDYDIYISDRFPNWQVSKSLHRGYRIDNHTWENKTKPLLEKGFCTKNPAEIFRPAGQYYDLVVGSIR